jgi:uncharacterized protein YjiS (DUF1127 family)
VAPPSPLTQGSSTRLLPTPIGDRRGGRTSPEQSNAPRGSQEIAVVGFFCPGGQGCRGLGVPLGSSLTPSNPRSLDSGRLVKIAHFQTYQQLSPPTTQRRPTSPYKSTFLCRASLRPSNWKGYVPPVLLGLEVVMSSIKRLARATTTWLTGAGSRNDLTTLSDRDLRDLGLVRRQIGINHQQVISVGNFL